MVSPISKDFPEEGVIVTIPEQVHPIEVQRIDLLAIEKMPSVRIGFYPFRLVINLKFVDPMHPEKELLDFDPRIMVRIRYTKDDYARAQAVRRPLCLGFWDGSRWIRCTASKHLFRFEYDTVPEDGGWGVIEVAHWGDPTQAWGT